jgi:hypothetical protein
MLLQKHDGGRSMKLWNVLGTVSRYVLAAISCISLAQFLLLLNVGTENAGRLAGQSLARGVISGLVAAVWFYRARRLRPPEPANVQIQVQVTPRPKSQGQPAASPLDSISATAPTSVLAASHSSSSFWQEHQGFVGLIAGAAIVIVVGALATGGMFQQSWTLGAGTSQPRFAHVQGAAAWKMVDNKTGQECNTKPVTYDSVDGIKQEMELAMTEEETQKLLKCNIASPNFPKCWASLNLVSPEKRAEIITKTLADSKPTSDPPSPFDPLFSSRSTYPQYKEFYDSHDAVIANPDKPPVYHYNGMPYCSELSKKWW